MAETNPGQQNVAYDAATNQPRLKVDTTYDENTSLEDIQSTYTDIGDQYNRFVQDARQNVADRQTEHIGNNFGASPYNTNTYYEPAATGFASAMRQQGTQQAFEVGMERGRKEAEANLNAAKSAYDNAATAYNTAYDNYQKSKQSPTAVTVDKSLLPEDVNEDEFAKYIASSGNAAQGMQRAIDAYGLNNAGVKDWNDQAVIDRVKSELGENSEAWQAYAKHMQERNSANQYGVSERFGDSELGRIWADTYAKNYFKTYYDDSYVQSWQTEYDKVRRLVTNLMGLRNGELNWSDTIVPEQDLPDDMCVGTNFQYINIIQPEFKSTDQAASENVKVNSDGSYTIDGQTYSYDEVRQKVAESQGTTPEELDKKQAGTLQTGGVDFDKSKTAFQDQVSQNKNNPLGQKWSPSSKEVWAAFAGNTAVGDLYSGYKTFSISADDVAEAVLGVDIHEAKAIAKMKAENPDGYARLTDQITRAITDATVFEVADGVKEYHTKDGYKVLDKGTVVMNVPDAVLDAEGNVIDKDLKRMMELYAESDDPTMNQQDLMDEYEKAWKAYATRVAWARAVTNQTDEQINSDIYAALLYSQDKNEYKDVKIGDKTAEELLAEFRQKTESNPEEAYREFTELWQKAYENVGYFFVNNGGKYEARNLYDENGDSMIGRYGEENSRNDMEANRAMALVALYANSMDAFNAGQKDGNINPNFIEVDGADDWNTFWTGIGRNIQADAHIVLSAAAGGVAGAATGTAAGPVVGNILGGIVGLIGGAIANGGLERDFGPGDFGYDVARNNKSSELLRQSVNPLSLSLWGLDDDKSDKFGTSYATIRAVGDFFRDALGMMSTLTLESIATAGIESVGTAALNGIKNGVASSAGKLLRAGQDLTIKNVADAAKRGVVQDLMNPTDEIGQSITTNVARDLANPTDEITQAVTEKYTSKAAETAAGYTDDLLDNVGEEAAKTTSRSSTVAGDIAKTQSMIDARITPAVKELNTVANNSMDDVMRSISYIANNIDDFTNFSIKFSEEATKFITKKSIAETLARAGYTNIDDATLNAATQFMRQNIQNLGGVAARQTYQTALISGFLGADPSIVSKATSETLTYLSKTIGKFYDNPSLVSNFSGVWGAVSSGQMSMEGVKKSFANILEASAKAAASGMTYGKSDIVRHLARDGWKTAQLKEVFKTAVFRDHGLADDMLYDIIHGYTVPTIDDEGNAVHMSVEDYFRTGQWIFPLAVNGLQMAGGAVFRRVQSAGLDKQLDKAQRALSSTAVDSPDYGKRFAEVQRLTAKAEKLANKIMDKNIEFGKMNDVAKKGHAYVDEANERLFQGLTKDMEAVDKNFSFKTRAEQAEFLKKRFKAPDAVAQAYVNAQTDAFITYPHLKRLLGGDNPSTLANLEERGIIATIWETMARVADENRMSIKNNKRFKSIWDKQAEMRRLQKNAVMDALRGPDGLSAVSDLESSLDSWFNAIDDVAKKNVANGVMTEDKVRLGYLPITGMLIGEPNDGVPAAARGLWLGDESGHAMAISAADPIMQREINVTDLIKAYKKGDKVASYLDSKGNVVEVEFNPQGFQFMDAAVAYRNSNTFHRTVGSILGGDAESTGGAAVKTGYVQFFGEKASKAAANADLTEINTQIADLETKAKAAMTDDLKKKDLRAKKRAEKALSNLARQEDSILKNMGRQTVAAEDMRLAAKTLTEIATEGRRPDNAPSVKELLGITDDSEAQKIFNAARQKVAQDIKKVQAGEKLGSTLYDGPTTIISGAQTGVDTIGLEVASELGYKTGGTTTPGFVRESGVDKHTKSTLSKLGVQEISQELQGGKSGKQFYLPRTEQNVINSDATVYFATDADSAGLAATKRFATQHKKPFLLNPDAEQLTQWLKDNNIKTLNVAGNRGSKLGSLDARNILKNALDKKNFGGLVDSYVDNTYARMIADAAKRNGHFDYDLVARRMLLDNEDKLYNIGLFEVSSRGDKRFSAFNAKLNKGTKVLGEDVGGMTIENAYQKVMKKSGKNAGATADSPIGKQIAQGIPADDAYYDHYKALWGEWVKQNPKLANELKTLARGKKLNDSFAKTENNQARALADILGLDYVPHNNKYSNSGVGPSNTDIETSVFLLAETGVNLTWDKNQEMFVPSTRGELAKIDLDKGSNRTDVNRELTRLIAENAGVSGDRGLKDQYMRVVQDAFSQAQTIMNDQIKVGDNVKVEGPDGGFSHGFFTYLDIVDRLLPDKDLYNTAVASKLVNRLNALGRDGITLRQLKDLVISKAEVERAAGNPVDDLVTTYKVLDMADDAGARATGTGDYTPGAIRGVEWGSGDEDDLGPSMAEGVTNIFGERVDSTDAYSSEFNAEDLMINRAQNPAQIDYNALSTKDKSIYDMIHTTMNLSEKDDLDKALKTAADTLSKMTNNGSKLYDPSLRAMREETAALFKTANDIRKEINTAVKELAKTDKETKKLIDAEAARRTARQASFGKKSQASATYDGSAALGIARPGSAVLYSENPARYNAIAASIRNREAGLAVDVHSLRGEGIPDAQSILAYFREGRKGLENLDSLINFDAGTPAGIYHQLRHAVLYLHEKGYDTTELGKKLNAMKTELGDSLDSYGDVYGNFNPPEFSLAAALAEVADKKSFFDDSLRNGVDRMKALSSNVLAEGEVYVTPYVPSRSGWKDIADEITASDNTEYKFAMEFTEAGESSNPSSVLTSLSDGESGNENLKLHLLDENENPVDVTALDNKYLLQEFVGISLNDAGPQGETVRLVQDGGSLRAEYDIDRTSGEVNKDLFRENRVDEKWTEYLVATKNKKSYDELMTEIQELEKRAARTDKKVEKLAGQRIQVEDETGNSKTKSLKSVIDEAQNVNYKKYMSPEDYELYKKLKTNKNQINDYLNGKTEVYHSLRGATFNGDGAGYSNMVRMSDYLKTLGYTPDAKELNADAFDAKLMKKQLRKGNLSAKKNWGKPVIDATALPDKMDKKSAELTVANLLGFYKQAVKQSGLDYIDMDQMWVDKSYLELLARYADTPNAPTGLMSFASKVSALPQWIQQQQLAGGWGPINALTLAQVRSAILEDPRKAITFARMLADMRNSKTAVTSVLDRSDLFARIAMHTGDGSIVTDLYPAISKRSGRDDGGIIQTFATKILDRADKERAVNRFPKGFRENIKADLEDFFENPTFMQAMPVLRAQMMSMNYDAALTKLQKKFRDRIGKDISTIEIEEAAMDVAYARTQKFFTPQKYWSGNMEAGLQKIKNENIRKLVGQITGEGTPTTVMDIASSAFFALRYKQTFVNRFVQGVKDFSGVPGMLRHQLSQSATVGQVAQDLSNVGQMKGIAALIGIAVLAKVWCDAMGIPNAWDDFDFNPEGDEVFHMPSVLMKFQNAGQIWLPNDTREDGTPYVNPNKSAYKLDPFFSMFTLPNSAMRAVNMAFNGATDSYAAPQGGIGLLTNGLGANMYGVNQFFNSPQWRAVSDELIGSNLLSPFKALHEIIVNRTYFGNNIWERKYLPDGRENPNYDPGRNAASSVMHLIGLDNVLDPNGYNRWVKGGDDMVRQDQVGTISGSGILQHEYASAAIALMSGDLFGAFTEAGELPIKTQRLSSNARTEMNTVVKNTLDHYGDDYRAKMKNATSVDQKDEIYAEYAKKCADEVARWSAKFGYLLGENQELVASSTRLLMAMTSGEYDDTMAYVQNAYWKASQIAQIESGTALFLKDSDLDDWLKNGGTVESFTEEKNRRSQAYNQALDEEWEARKALIDAGYNPEYLAGSSYEDLRAEQRSVSKKIYTSIMNKFEKSLGEFKNYKELQAYYEEMIANAGTKKQKVKLANQYNDYIKDIISEAIAEYGPAVLTEATYNGKGITQQISDYIIIPADKYYTGKTPKSNYLRDLYGVGYRNGKNLPSDDELREKWDTVKWLVSHGKPASASTMLDTMVKNIKNGRWYASDVDYSDIIRLKSKLRSKQ